MRGKLTIIAILVVALAAATFAWWWRATSQRRIREFWGQTAQQTISFAKRVEAFKLPNADADSKPLRERIEQLPPEAFVDITHAPGLIHAKHSLLEEASFEWEAPPPSQAKENWNYGVRFQNGTETVTVLFDFEQRRLAYVEAEKFLTLIEKTSRDWRDYLDRRAFAEPRELQR
jgi:hypothetical protein